jgi:hypothetical protein
VNTCLEVSRLVSKENARGKEVVRADVTVDRTGGGVAKVCVDDVGTRVVSDAGRQRDELLSRGLLRKRHHEDEQTEHSTENT